MSLKRFDINYANMSRFKVNTKFEFPLMMDISALKRGSNIDEADAEDDNTQEAGKPSDKANITSNIRHNMIWLEQLKTKKGEKEAQRRYKRLRSLDSDTVYELYAIVIHSGKLSNFIDSVTILIALIETCMFDFLQCGHAFFNYLTI